MGTAKFKKLIPLSSCSLVKKFDSNNTVIHHKQAAHLIFLQHESPGAILNNVYVGLGYAGAIFCFEDKAQAIAKHEFLFIFRIQ